ncbi:MAG: ABC transporter permease [Desulfobacterales bacterium]|jgi:phospholipid/cholesterol/gamma-HCH transport system permease protein
MNDEGVISRGNDTSQAGLMPRRVLATIGKWVIGLWLAFVRFISDALAVIWQSCRPITWRQSIRTEFMRQCYEVGASALPFILFSGVFVGIGILAQGIHWLRLFGSTELFGDILSIVLVRELAPVLVGLILIGRSGSKLLFELGTLKVEGQVHMLDAQGIDPFLYLVVPRVLAFCICMFSLTVVLVAVAYLSGFAVGALIGLIRYTFFDFLNRTIGSLELQTYVLFTLKTVAIGFAVALISCKTALSVSGVSANVMDIMPWGFVKSALANLIISIALTFLFS